MHRTGLTWVNCCCWSAPGGSVYTDICIWTAEKKKITTLCCIFGKPIFSSGCVSFPLNLPVLLFHLPYSAPLLFFLSCSARNTLNEIWGLCKSWITNMDGLWNTRRDTNTDRRTHIPEDKSSFKEYSSITCRQKKQNCLGWLDREGRDANKYMIGFNANMHSNECKKRSLRETWHTRAHEQTHNLDIKGNGGWWWAQCKLKNNLHKTPLQYFYVAANFLVWLLITPACHHHHNYVRACVCYANGISATHCGIARDVNLGGRKRGACWAVGRLNNSTLASSSMNDRLLKSNKQTNNRCLWLTRKKVNRVKVLVTANALETQHIFYPHKTCYLTESKGGGIMARKWENLCLGLFSC